MGPVIFVIEPMTLDGLISIKLMLIDGANNCFHHNMAALEIHQQGPIKYKIRF